MEPWQAGVAQPLRGGRVLVPLDLSPTAFRVLPWAAALARSLSGSLLLFHVYVPARGLLLLAPEVGDPEERRRHLLEEAHRSLAQAVEDLRAQDVSASYEVREEPEVEELLSRQRDALVAWVGDQILHRARDAEIAAIVLASHGQGGRPDLALGSVAYYVLKRCPKPLLVVPVLL